MFWLAGHYLDSNFLPTVAFGDNIRKACQLNADLSQWFDRCIPHCKGHREMLQLNQWFDRCILHCKGHREMLQLNQWFDRCILHCKGHREMLQLNHWFDRCIPHSNGHREMLQLNQRFDRSFLRINVTENNFCHMGNWTHNLDTNCLAQRNVTTESVVW